jgi:hypothetical protein
VSDGPGRVGALASSKERPVLLRLASSNIIRELAREKTNLSEEELDKLLDARKMTEA